MWARLGFLAVLGCGAPQSATEGMPINAGGKADAYDEVEPVELTLLQINLGNADVLHCHKADYKLCEQEVEDAAAKRIAKLRPDVVVMQELFPYHLCLERDWKKKYTCHDYEDRDVPDQVRRLLGDDYTIVCDARLGWECIGFRDGVIDEVRPDAQGRRCELGQVCTAALLMSDTLNEAGGVDEYEAEVVVSSRTDGFQMLAVDVAIAGQEVRFINGHPESGIGALLASRERARAEQVESALSAWGDHPNIILAGDMNLDPFTAPDDPSAEVWNRWVDVYDEDGNVVEEGVLHYLSGPAEDWPPPITAPGLPPIFPRRTLDHVVSSFADGSCETLDTDDERIDGGDGMDHYGLLCRVRLSW